MSSTTALPLIDLTALSSPEPTIDALTSLSQSLSHAFSTTGFAYLINAPLTFTHAEVFALAHDFFSLPQAAKLSVAKKTFVPQNTNTYRGYFPPQPGSDNLKEGFEIGPSNPLPQTYDPHAKFNLTEPNVWPAAFPSRHRAEQLHTELQSLSTTLLALLATALSKPPSFFAPYTLHSTSTLRLLHYPIPAPNQLLSCTPHTDSGILTLLFQDDTGGLEILTPSQQWIPAPYRAGAIVVNVGDLLARVSDGRFRATTHRVRCSRGRDRFSVPFFCEPGVACLVGEGEGEGEVRYGRLVMEKMRGWVEFRGVEEEEEEEEEGRGVLLQGVGEVGVGVGVGA